VKNIEKKVKSSKLRRWRVLVPGTKFHFKNLDALGAPFLCLIFIEIEILSLHVSGDHFLFCFLSRWLSDGPVSTSSYMRIWATL